MSKLDAYLAEVNARDKEATWAPWEFVEGRDHIGPVAVVEDSAGNELARMSGRRDRANGEFIAHARTDVKVLARMVKELLPLVDAPVVEAARQNLERLVWEAE